MLKKTIPWFRSPIFEDEEKTRKAMLLNVVVNTCIITLPIIFLMIIAGNQTPRFGIRIFIITSCWLIILGMKFLMNSGRVSAAGIVVVSALFIGTTVGAYNNGTLHAPAPFIYIIVIIITGLSVGRRAIVWATLFSSTAVIILWLGERNGTLPKPYPTSDTTQVTVLILLFVIVTILISLAINNMDKSLDRAHQELRERVLAREREISRSEMMEKVILIGKAITEQTFDLRTALFKIWSGVRNGLDFDRTAIFIYNPTENIMQGTYGTDRSGRLSDEWNLKFNLNEADFFKSVLSQPDGFYFTQDYETERGLLTRPGHIMQGVKYYAAVAVWAGDKPVAILTVDQLVSGRVITEEQLEALRLSAGYAGLAIENARLSEKEQIRRTMMQKVIELGMAVTEQITDLRITLLKIRNSVRDGLDIDRAAVFLFDASNNMLHGSYGTDRSGKLSEEWDLEFESHDNTNFLHRVISQPDGFFHTDDYERDLNFELPSNHAMKGVKYFAAFACWNGGKPVAIICTDQLISGRVITDEQLEALRFFAGYAGLAIENARLSEHEQDRQKMMGMVIRVGKEIAEQITDLRSTLFKIWETVRYGFDLDRVAIFIYNPNDHTVQGSYGTDRTGKLAEEWDMKFKPLQSGILQKVISQPDGFYFTSEYEVELNITDPTNPMRGVKYYASVACWSGDKPVAVICTDQLISGRVITDEQLEALRLFAGYAGLAIDNARLNTELKGRMQEREKFIQELGNRNAELERFTYTVSHDLRSPLVTIKGFVGMLNKDIHEGQNEKVERDMQRIANAADKMEALLSDLLKLSRIGRVVNPPEEIDLVKLAYDTLETVDGRIRSKNITARVSPNLPIIHADRARIGEVLENLVDNAAKYMGVQPAPLIEINARMDNGEHVIYVKDNGMGIEPQYLERIFGLFEKLNPASEGTGIGLALIKRIIEVHGGRIWVESDGAGKGSTFCFTIPNNQVQNKN